MEEVVKPGNWLVESPALEVFEDMWMQPLRTWVGGDHGGGAGWT